MGAEKFIVNLFCFWPLALVLAVIFGFCIIYTAVYWRWTTRKSFVTADVGSLVIGVSLCGWFGWIAASNLQRNYALRDEARNGREATLASLPNVDGFEQIATVRQLFGAREGPGWYGRAYVVVGTDLSVEAALAAYRDAVMAQDWKVPPRRDPEDTVFERGIHERLNIDINPASEYSEAINEVKDDPAYVMAKQRYPTILVVSIDYIVPCRGDC